MLRLLFLFLVAATALFAASVDELVRDGIAAEKAQDPAKALKLFLQADAAKPNDALILQKIARQYSDQVPEQKTDDARREFATHGLEYSQRAVALEPNNAVNVLSLAICHGHLGLVSDTRTKVEYSRLIKDEAERALQLDPNYAWAHHVLGRWHCEVASFGGTARFFAKLFYGGIPPASNAEAVTHLKRATELEPTELNHWIYLGIAYAANGQKAEARASLQKGLAMPDQSTHDETAKKKARETLAGLN